MTFYTYDIYNDFNYSSFDIDKKILTFTKRVPRIDQKAAYDINGKIMVMPIFGNGNSILTLCKYLLQCSLNIYLNLKMHRAWAVPFRNT